MAEGIPARLRLSRREGRRFGLTVGGAFLVLALVAWWRAQVVLLGSLGVLGGLLVLAGLLVPTWLGPVQQRWMALAHVMSRVTTPIFMGIVYYGVFTPIGLSMRLFGRNPMVRKEGGTGFWVRRSSEDRSSHSMERQF